VTAIAKPGMDDWEGWLAKVGDVEGQAPAPLFASRTKLQGTTLVLCMNDPMLLSAAGAPTPPSFIVTVSCPALTAPPAKLYGCGGGPTVGDNELTDTSTFRKIKIAKSIFFLAMVNPKLNCT